MQVAQLLAAQRWPAPSLRPARPPTEIPHAAARRPPGRMREAVREGSRWRVASGVATRVHVR